MKNSIDALTFKNLKEDVEKIKKEASGFIDYNYDLRADSGTFKNEKEWTYIFENLSKLVFVNIQDGMRLMCSFIFPVTSTLKINKTPLSDEEYKKNLKAASEVPIAEYHNFRYNSSNNYTVSTLQIIAVKVGVMIMQVKWVMIREVKNNKGFF